MTDERLVRGGGRVSSKFEDNAAHRMVSGWVGERLARASLRKAFVTRSKFGLLLALAGGYLAYRIFKWGFGENTAIPLSSRFERGAARRERIGRPPRRQGPERARRTQRAQPVRAEKAEREPVEITSEDSFPASDPPAWTGGRT